jgi:hypothetical protein
VFSPNNSRVINQYQELVQNEAKCPVKMSHSSSGSASLSQLSPGKETEVCFIIVTFLYLIVSQRNLRDVDHVLRDGGLFSLNFYYLCFYDGKFQKYITISIINTCVLTI